MKTSAREVILINTAFGVLLAMLVGAIAQNLLRQGFGQFLFVSCGGCSLAFLAAAYCIATKNLVAAARYQWAAFAWILPTILLICVGCLLPPAPGVREGPEEAPLKGLVFCLFAFALALTVGLARIVARAAKTDKF